MTALAIISTTVLVWLTIGLFVANRIEAKVVRLALMVLGSAALWPLTLWTSRKKTPKTPTVTFADEVAIGE